MAHHPIRCHSNVSCRIFGFTVTEVWMKKAEHETRRLDVYDASVLPFVSTASPDLSSLVVFPTDDCWVIKKNSGNRRTSLTLKDNQTPVFCCPGNKKPTEVKKAGSSIFPCNVPSPVKAEAHSTSLSLLLKFFHCHSHSLTHTPSDPARSISHLWEFCSFPFR